MKDADRVIKVMKSALETILLETKEPITKVYAQSALDETASYFKASNDPAAGCAQHKWFGQHGERCPICKQEQIFKK